MPLPSPAPRAPIHTREVVCRGFRREDGLWDVEGRITDVKAYAFDNAHRGTLLPGEPLHDMSLRLTLDDDLTVVGVEAVTDAAPYAVCPAITPNFRRLIGLRVGAGWRKAVRQRVGGVEGCTHLVELLGPIATTAFQTIYPLRPPRPRTTDDRPPPHLDTCHALARDGEVVRHDHPRWYNGDAKGAGNGRDGG